MSIPSKIIIEFDSYLFSSKIHQYLLIKFDHKSIYFDAILTNNIGHKKIYNNLYNFIWTLYTLVCYLSFKLSFYSLSSFDAQKTQSSWFDNRYKICLLKTNKCTFFSIYFCEKLVPSSMTYWLSYFLNSNDTHILKDFCLNIDLF